VGTRAAGECFHSFFEFSQTLMSVSMMIETLRTRFLFLLENTMMKKGKQLVTWAFRGINSVPFFFFFCIQSQNAVQLQRVSEVYAHA